MIKVLFFTMCLYHFPEKKSCKSAEVRSSVARTPNRSPKAWKFKLNNSRKSSKKKKQFQEISPNKERIPSMGPVNWEKNIVVKK